MCLRPPRGLAQRYFQQMSSDAVILSHLVPSGIIYSRTCTHNLVLFPFYQTITGAMSTINPPVKLADASSQFRVDYIQDVASQPEFEYPTVSR